jgi:hypothetical protein
MTIRTPDRWLFSGGDDLVAKPGFMALLSYDVPASAVDPTTDWLEIDEQVDGMRCGVLKAYILPLPVSEARLREVLEATHWSGTEGAGWRHNLSWHNTPMDAPNDPTVQAYIRAITSLGLAWTPPLDMRGECYGRRLAQAVYPLDPTDSNLLALGISGCVDEMLGEPVDQSRHFLVLLTPNDD